MFYTGKRLQQGCKILVTPDITGMSEELPLRTDLRNHSPTGFEWGYNGSGPSQTALAILAHHLKDETNHPSLLYVLRLTKAPSSEELGNIALADYLALQYYQTFKALVVSKLPEEWQLTSNDINKIIVTLEDFKFFKEVKLTTPTHLN